MAVAGPADRATSARLGLERVLAALPFVAVFVVTFVVNIGYSLRQGRLASVPIHDDVAYLADGLDRVLFGKGSGLWSAIGSFLANPPHAPVTTLTAMLGFWALGPAPISAYLANFWVFGLYIAVFAVMSRPLESLVARVLFVGVLAFVPIAHAMVTEFRPDMAGGLLFAVALAAICFADFRTITTRDKLVLAVVAVAATVTKPTAIVLTIPALGVAFAAAMTAQGLFRAPDRRRLLLGGLACVALYWIGLIPFATVFGHDTLSYIHDTLFTDSDIWTTEGSRWFHWTYHFSGPGGTDAMGVFAYVALAIILVDLVLHIRHPALRRRGALPLYATLAVIYCAMAISKEKTVFQGSFFYLPFLFAAASAFVGMAAEARRRWPLAAAATSGLLGVGAVLALLFLPLGGSVTFRAADGAEANSLLPKIADAIFALDKNEWRDSPSCLDRTMLITVLNYDPVTAGAIQMAVAEGGVRLLSNYVFFPRSLAEAFKSMDDVDLVVMADPAAKPTNQWLLLNTMAPDIYRYLSEKPGMKKIQVGEYRGHPFWLFAKPHCDPVTPP